MNAFTRSTSSSSTSSKLSASLSSGRRLLVVVRRACSTPLLPHPLLPRRLALDLGGSIVALARRKESSPATPPPPTPWPHCAWYRLSAWRPTASSAATASHSAVWQRATCDEGVARKSRLQRVSRRGIFGFGRRFDYRTHDDMDDHEEEEEEEEEEDDAGDAAAAAAAAAHAQGGCGLPLLRCWCRTEAPDPHSCPKQSTPTNTSGWHRCRRTAQTSRLLSPICPPHPPRVLLLSMSTLLW